MRELFHYCLYFMITVHTTRMLCVLPYIIYTYIVVLALVAGGYMAVSGNVRSEIGAFLGCVAIIFIHDMAKRVRNAFEYMVSMNMYLLFSFITIAIGVITSVLVHENQHSHH